ncbi:6-hydroxymethylpterin diphosphokinase MptE-like protein [Magnetospirillum sp. 64-120]|uniref:motility associated factor glycosyltransferase family protein n=1 Tax=Magnetospirillum sp. 64-120 TaxID=1895778 RepID=UPI0025C5863E|nr:6-hydroxymethylpterin diphosphokinase MptE-like protein [Magnetospirillum sp. 64-120]
MSTPGMLAANMALMERKFPAIHAVLAQKEQGLATPVLDGDCIVDIDLGSGRLYKGDARQMAADQVEAFVAAPYRAGYKSVEGIAGDSMVCRRYMERILDSLRSMEGAAISSYPRERAGYLFVFGLGLGFHLPLLAEKLDVETIVVVEAIDEFVSLSLKALDWCALDDAMTGRGQKLHLILGAQPNDIAERLNGVIGTQGEMLLDGAYLYRHYPFWPLDEAYQRLINDIPTKMVGRGYYEDERKMIRHAVVNLHRHDHYLIRGRFRRRYSVPAFIVAAGPSLDESIEYIRQWKDHAIVFSAGTTLQPLLKAGIIPDYHVELENIATLHSICMHFLELRPDLFPEKRFTGMKLIASVTVSPMVTPLFDELYFFFRDSATSTASYGEGIEEMNGVGPSIANTCMAVAARLGFEDMYLFGTDCGWRDQRNHHAKSTMYYTMDDFKVQSFEGEFAAPGNFGGTIYSNLVYTWTRDMIEQKVDKFALKVFNCSDGAFIRGTTPLLPESLFFPGKPLDKEAVFKRIRDESEFYAAGQFLQGHDMGRYVTEVELLRVDLLDLLKQAEADKISFRELINRLHDFDREGYVGPYRHIYPLYQGSIIGFVKAASFYMNRLPEQCLSQFMQDFIDIYRDLHVEMLDEGRQIYEESKIMVEGGPEPEWADGKLVYPGFTY